MPSSDGQAVRNEFVSGVCGGIFGIFCGMPLDLLKTRVQTMKQFQGASMRESFLVTLRSEGVLALYRGMAFPMYSQGIVNAVVFSVQGSTKRYLKTSLGHDRERLCGFLAGCTAGFVQTPIVTCAELIKCQLQTRTVARGTATGEITTGLSPWTVLRSRIRQLGIMQGCFLGAGVTAVRETPSYGIYFLVYGTMTSVLEDQVPHMLRFILSGGAAGMVSMGLVHPFDVVKSNMQSLSQETPPEERSAVRIAKRGYAETGWRFFFRGFAPAQCRHFVVNAAIFSGYEVVKGAIESLGV